MNTGRYLFTPALTRKGPGPGVCWCKYRFYWICTSGRFVG